IGVHLVGGILGSLLLGLFATTAVNSAGRNGLFFGGGLGLLGDQALAVGSTLAYSLVLSLVIAKIIDVTMGLRVSPDDEAQGLDITQHAESAYLYGELGSMARSGE